MGPFWEVIPIKTDELSNTHGDNNQPLNKKKWIYLHNKDGNKPA